jgi:NAD(P)-dependent dehydrogenase (short-subunit alcohol dehydrogenase family)
MNKDLQGKVAVVTGAAQGIGLAIATHYAAAGASVVMTDINTELLKDAAESIPSAIALPVDVTDPDSVEELFTEVLRLHGRIDVLNPNAGVLTIGALEHMSYTQWRQVTSVCLDGVFLSIRYGAPAMRAGGGGVIINTCSVLGEVGCALVGHYAAAKAGVLSLTRTAAVELRDGGIRVNAILPGFVDTDMVRSRRPEFEPFLSMPFDDLIAARQGRFGTADDVARTAVFLASERARGCSGAGYTVDGGFRASGL